MKNYKLLPSHIKLIRVDDKIVLFLHTETLQIYPIEDIRLFKFLKYFSEHGEDEILNLYTVDEYKKLKQFVCDVIAKAPMSINWNVESNGQPTYATVVLPISAKCTLQCPYCFAQTDGGFHFGDYNNESIKKTIDFIIHNNPNKDENIWIVFFGGEPLLNFEGIKFTIEYLKTNYPNQKISYSITTNGTILNDEIIKVFQDNDIAVLVSLDGPNNEFNLRSYKNGKASFEDVMINIERLRQTSIRMEIRATLVNSNPYICETFVFFEDLKIPYSIAFAYTSSNKSHQLADYTDSTLSFIQEQFNNKLLQIYEKKLQKKEKIYNKKFHQYLETIRFRYKRNLPCGAGRGYITITANGDVYSCPHFMNETEFRMGNIETGITETTKYTSVPVYDIDDCGNCWAKNLCLGHCLGQKISAGKTNKMAMPNNECELEKITAEFYVKLFYLAKKYAPHYFKKPNE